MVVRPPGCQAGSSRLTDWICTHFSLTRVYRKEIGKRSRDETRRGSGEKDKSVVSC